MEKNLGEKNNKYDKVPDYIEAVFRVFIMVNTKAELNRDKKFKMIALVIFNYVKKMAKDYEVDLKPFFSINEIKHYNEKINLIPIFEYVSYNNIELYDFSKISMNDVDTSNNNDLERFVLSHIYYITQTNN
jgi:hypothetical protein